MLGQLPRSAGMALLAQSGLAPPPNAPRKNMHAHTHSYTLNDTVKSVQRRIILTSVTSSVRADGNKA